MGWWRSINDDGYSSETNARARHYFGRDPLRIADWRLVVKMGLVFTEEGRTDRKERMARTKERRIIQ